MQELGELACLVYSCLSLSDEQCSFQALHLEDEVLDICKTLNLTVENSDIKGCHRIGKGNPKTTIVRFDHDRDLTTLSRFCF